MSDQPTSTRYLQRDGGRIAYDVRGSGSLIVLLPGMMDTRQSYRFLAPKLADAGYRVASLDLRGLGDSSKGWSSYSHRDVAEDVVAVIGELGAPAAVVGQSFSGGAASIAAGQHPEAVRALVEIDPFTRPQGYSVGALMRNRPYRRGLLLLGRFMLTGSVGAWRDYLVKVAYPGRRPADWDTWLAALLANVREPGRADAGRQMMKSSATLNDAAENLPRIRCPTLILMGEADSDFASPGDEAAALVGLLPDGVGRYEMIAGAGHYPHAQYPDEVATAIISFLRAAT